MPFGFYIIMAAQFFSSLADNALLVAAIACSCYADEDGMTPLLNLCPISYGVRGLFGARRRDGKSR